MKKIFLLALLLCAGHRLVFATDITINASAIPNANMSAGSDLVSVCAVTNGSNVVSASGAFRSTMVGLGGFQITINGTRYTVDGVQSANQLTLTTPYAGTTSASASFTLYRYVLLRIYALNYFTPGGASYVVPAGDPTGGEFYKQAACSLINTGSGATLYIPAITLPATTDATNPEERDSRYFAGFYTAGGAQIRPYDCFSSFRLPFSPTVTTWTALCTVQSPGGSPPVEYDGYVKSQVYNKGEINAILPECAAGQIAFFKTNGRIQKCLGLGINLSIDASDTLNASGSGSSGGGYSQLQNNGTNVAQRLTLNFSDNLVAVDDAANTRTNLRLGRVPTGVYNLITDYNASGIPDETTGTASAGSNQVVLPAFPSYQWKPGFGILIVGAGPSGSDLLTTVASVASNVLTLQASASTNISNAVVRHDDTAAVQAAVNAKGDVYGPQGHYIVSQPISLPATTEGASLTFEGAGKQGETTFHYQGLGSMFIGADGASEGLVFRNFAIATSTPGSYSTVRPTVNRGSAFDFSKSAVVSWPTFEQLRIIGWGRWGIYCANCQGGWYHNNIFRSNAQGHLGLVGPETLSPGAPEPNVSSIRDNWFDQAPYINDADVAIAGGSMANNSYVLTVTAATFTTSHEGRMLRIVGAGAGGGDLIGLIKSVDSSLQATLSVRNQTGGNLTGLSGTIYKSNYAGIYLHRSNNDTLASNIIQGNWSGSPGNVPSLKVENAKAVSIENVWIESTGGAAGFDIDLVGTKAITIKNYHSNADPVTANENAGGNIKLTGALNTYIVGMDNPNPTIHISADANTRGTVIEGSYLSAPENLFNQYDLSPDRITVGEGVTFANDAATGAGRRGTATIYDDVLGLNWMVNPRGDDGSGYGSWTNTNATYSTYVSGGSNRYQKYWDVNTQALVDGGVNTAFEQVISIPDSYGAGPWALGYDFYVTNFGAAPAVGREVQVLVAVSAGTGYDGFKITSQNASNLPTGKWERGQYVFYLGAGTSRTITVRVRASTGTNTPRVRLGNFRLMPGKHATGSRDEAITELVGGRIRAAAGLSIDNALTFNGSASPGSPVGGTGRMRFDTSSGKFKCSENGAAEVNCIGAGGGSGTGTQVTISQTGHGFSTSACSTSGGVCLVRPIFFGAANLVESARNDTQTKWSTGLIVAVPDANTLTVALAPGFYTVTGHGLTTKIYFLSDTGGLTDTPGSTNRQAVLEVYDANTIHYFGLLQNPGGGTLGTVSSVAMSVPSFLSVSGSPINTSGTFAVSLTSQTSNLGFMSPDAASGVPGFRKVVIADLNSTALSGNGTKLATIAGTTSSGKCLEWDGGGNVVTSASNLPCGSGGGGGFGPPASNGFVVNVGGSPVARNIVGTASQVTVVDGDGQAGSAVISLPSTVRLGTPSGAAGTLQLANSSNAFIVSFSAGTPTASFSLIAPTSLPGSTLCMTLSATGQMGTSACGSGGGLADPGADGWVSRTGSNTLVPRTFVAGTNMSITFTTGAGNPTFGVTGPPSVSTLTTNGVLYGAGTGPIQATAASSSGTFCLVSANGGPPTWGSCAGTASTSWSSLSNPSANLAINLGTFTSTFTVSSSDSATTRRAITFSGTSTSAVSPGYGVGVGFTLKDSAGVIQDAGDLAFEWWIHSSANRSSQTRFRQIYSGSTGTALQTTALLRPDRLVFSAYDVTAGSIPELLWTGLNANTSGFKGADNPVTSYSFVMPASVPGGLPGSNSDYALTVQSGNVLAVTQLQKRFTVTAPLVYNSGTDVLSIPSAMTQSGGFYSFSATVLFASLGTPANFTVAACADCAANTNPCTGGGTGAIAKRLNGAWDCR